MWWAAQVYKYGGRAGLAYDMEELCIAGVEQCRLGLGRRRIGGRDGADELVPRYHAVVVRVEPGERLAGGEIVLGGLCRGQLLAPAA